MIKRILEISDGPAYLSIADDQLVIKREGAELSRAPCEDIGILLVDNRAVTYSHSTLTRLLRHGAVVVLCGEDHLPAGLLLPIEGNALITQRFRAQVQAKLPLRKQLWRQIVRHKVRGQAANLPASHPARLKLMNLADEVRSGDPSNIEGQAGRVYWPALLGEDFRRDRDGLPPNNLLNYGYMVMRSALARAICAAGLHPAIGLHHHNRSNAFCLADDLVEVLRPRVDAAVLSLVRQDIMFLDKPAKAVLLNLLSHEIPVAGQSGPMMVNLHRIVASLVRCYEGTQTKLDLPEE